MTKQQSQPIDRTRITSRETKHGRVYTVPSRSNPDEPRQVRRHPVTGKWICPCACCVHRGTCPHVVAVEALEAEEAELALEGKSLADLADLDRAYQEQQARGERLTPAERAHWLAVMAAWQEAKYGPLAA